MAINAEKVSSTDEQIQGSRAAVSKIMTKVVTRVGVIGLSIITTFALGYNANAGDRLLFKSGAVDTNHIDASTYSATMNQGPAFYIVQFKTRIATSDQKNLNSLGAKIVRYIPEDALVVKTTVLGARTIERSSSNVQTVLPYAPMWKVSLEIPPASVFSNNIEGQVLVRLFPGEDSQAIEAQLQEIRGLNVIETSGRSIVLSGTRSQIDEVAAIPAVEWVQPMPQMETFNFRVGDGAPLANPTTQSGDYKDLTGFESGTHVMNFDAAWGRGFAGKGQTVGMADSGLDMGDIATIHQDFAGRVPTGFIFGMFSKSWSDPMGHGTHVAGSVMGGGAASGGLIKGGANQAQFIPEGMWSPMLKNLTVPPKLADLFNKAYDSGARIHTNSWGTAANPGAYDGFAQQVDEYMAAHPDMLILFAAGNSGVDADRDGRVDPNSVGSPGTAKNTLTVGASKNFVMTGGIQKKLNELSIGKTSWGTEPLASTRLSENAAGLAPFSSRGPTQDGRIKPEVVAPGTNILSNRSREKAAEPLWGVYNDDYVWSGGTSMSTPLVAGAAAVVRQYLVDDRKMTQPSAALIKAVLMHTAFDMYPGQFGEVGKAAGQELITARPNIDEGYGRVDMAKATNLAGSILIDEKTGISAGETQSFPVRVNGTAKLTATLVYTDAAAAAGATKSLVNDLDLVLVDSTGKEVARLNDRTNNNELIERAAQAGTYEIRVVGFNVPQGPSSGRQPYALVVSVQ